MIWHSVHDGARVFPLRVNGDRPALQFHQNFAQRSNTLVCSSTRKSCYDIVVIRISFANLLNRFRNSKGWMLIKKVILQLWSPQALSQTGKDTHCEFPSCFVFKLPL